MVGGSSLQNVRAGLDLATRDYRSLAAIVLGLAIVQAGVSALSAFAPLDPRTDAHRVQPDLFDILDIRDLRQ